MFTLQIYESSAQSELLADYSKRVNRSAGGGGLRFGTNQHGFAALSAPFIPMPLEEAFLVYDWPGTPHVVASDQAAGVQWEGRLEDIAIVPGGIRLGGLGYWRALRDVAYSALWSDSSTAGWRAMTDDDLPAYRDQKFAMDNNNRLFMATQKDGVYGASHSTGQVYFEPDQGETNVAEVVFTYEFNMSADWTARLRSGVAGFGGLVTEWSLVGDGTKQTGTVTQAVTAYKTLVFFDIRNTSGGSVTETGETGDQHLKVTGVRVKSQSGTVYASDIAAAMATYVNGINSAQLSASTALIEATSTDLQDEVYEDAWPADILDRLAGLHGYEVGVWEDRRLHFRTKGSQGRTWYVDVSNILQLERSLDPLRNSVYGVYKDANGRTLRTAVADDAESQGRYAIVRREAVKVQTTSSTEAETHRDAFLTDRADFAIRADVVFERVFDANGAAFPLYGVRAGDSLVMRNLPATLGTAIDNIRSFRIGETEYDAEANSLSVAPEEGIPTLVRLMARRAAGMDR